MAGGSLLADRQCSSGFRPHSCGHCVYSHSLERCRDFHREHCQAEAGLVGGGK